MEQYQREIPWYFDVYHDTEMHVSWGFRGIKRNFQEHHEICLEHETTMVPIL